MHELEIAQSLLRTISDWRDQNGAPVVLSVRIELGPLCGVDPEAMKYAWDAACEFACGGKLQGCRLVMDQLPITYECSVCSRTFESEKLVSTCQICGVEYPRRRGGRELNLKSIEVE